MRHVVENEAEIVWLDDASNYDYLREVVSYSSFRTKRPACTAGRLVAYATLKASAQRAVVFERRYWYVKDYDRFAGNRKIGKSPYKNETIAPSEAVVPGSIVAGAESKPWRSRVEIQL